MNLAQIVKMDLLLNRISNVLKEDATMQVKIPQLVTLVCTLLGTLGAPTLMNTQVHAHLGLYTGLVAAAMILHALLPSIFGAPSAADQQATGMSNKAGLFLLAGLGLALAYPAGMRAQITPAPPTPAQITSAFATTLAVSETIRELRQVPSGELYATLCGRMSLATYDAMIATLKRTGLVTETAHMLRWAGPEFHGDGGVR